MSRNEIVAPPMAEGNLILNHSSPKRIRNNELTQLRDRLRNLQFSDGTNELFKEIRIISRELDAKAAAVAEEIATIEESFPLKKIELASKREELRRLKKEVLAMIAEHKHQTRKVLDILGEAIPDIVPRLESLGTKMQKLEELKCQRKCGQLLAAVNDALSEGNPTLISSSLATAKDFVTHVQQVYEAGLEVYRHDLVVVVEKAIAWSRLRVTENLEKIGWPWFNSADERAFKEEIDEVTNCLSVIFVGNSIGNSPDRVAVLISDSLFARISDRFTFHFCGSTKTGDASHPEWFLAQLLLWMQHSAPLFSSLLQEVCGRVNGCSEFYLRCSRLAQKKAESLLKSKLYEEDIVLFSKLVDELIQFEQQRKELDIGCPLESEANSLWVLCEERVREKWLVTENVACSARVDDILVDEGRWHHRFLHVNSLEDCDPLLVCEAADNFVALIECLRQRVCLLPDQLSRRLFIDLQVMLIDDYRCRLVHISSQAQSPWSEPFPQIMNACWWMRESLEEWGEMDLDCSDAADSEIRRRLEESLKMYGHVWEQRAADLLRSFRAQLEHSADGYASLNWRAMEKWKGTERDLSTAFCNLLMQVRTAFSWVSDQICSSGQKILYKKMTSAVSQTIRERVIEAVHFNQEGAEQMHHDVLNGLVVLLNSIFLRSNHHDLRAQSEKNMVWLISALRLLSFSIPNAVLMRDELRSSTEEAAEEKLNDIKIHSIDKESALSLLRRRCDMRMDSHGALKLK